MTRSYAATEFPEREVSGSARWSRSVAVFSLVLGLTAVASHRFGLLETIAFLWVLGLVALIAFYALLLAGMGLERLWNFGDRGGRDVAVGTLIACIVLAPYAIAAHWMIVYPMLRDVSTDTANPPVITAVTRTPAMNALRPQSEDERRLQAQYYPLVISHRYDMAFTPVVEALRTVLGRQGWQMTAPLFVRPGETVATVEALVRSPILGLPADVALRVTADGDDTVLVDMRSTNRYGRHDLGSNADRIGAFLQELDDEVAGLVGAVPLDAAQP